MVTASARRVASTAFAAVALVLVLGDTARAAPPQCVAPPPQTVVERLQLILGGSQYCSDPDGDPLTFTVGSASHGWTGVVEGLFGYISDAGYTGPDAFTLSASDGTAVSDPVTVTITVTPNQPPSCPATRRIHVVPDTPASFDPREGCLDDGYILNAAIVDPPVHGTGGPPDPIFGGLLYTPDPGYQGPDTFTVAITDHLGASAEVVFEVTIAPNRAPTCTTPITLQVPVGGRLPLDHRNTCSDPDGDPTSAELITAPSHGRLELSTLPLVDYVADPGYTGPDRIVYRVRDSLGAASNDAVVDLVIGDAPAQQQQQQQQMQTQMSGLDLTGPVLELERSGPRKLAAVRKNGLRLRIASDEAGNATIELSVKRRAARRLGIDRKADGPVVVGRTTKTLFAGENELVVRLTKRARRRLASAKRVTMLVVVDVRDHLDNTTRETLEVTLRR